jgi:hypothetical protein
MLVSAQLRTPEISPTSRHPHAPIARPARRRRHGTDVAIRIAKARDAAAVHELEALDGRLLGTGAQLLAELGGIPVAAIAVADDTVVADPFEKTAQVVDLLRIRARQLRVAGTAWAA